MFSLLCYGVSLLLGPFKGRAKEKKKKTKEANMRDFPGGPVDKNPPSNAGDTGSIPGRGTKIPHATGQLGPLAATREPKCHNYRAHALWSRRTTTREACDLQLEKPARHN